MGKTKAVTMQLRRVQRGCSLGKSGQWTMQLRSQRPKQKPKGNASGLRCGSCLVLYEEGHSAALPTAGAMFHALVVPTGSHRI